MIKEKHEKGSVESVKDDPVNANKEHPPTTTTTTTTTTLEIQNLNKNDDNNDIIVKKEPSSTTISSSSTTTTTTSTIPTSGENPTTIITKNGSLIVGSTNTGSLLLQQQSTTTTIQSDLKTEPLSSSSSSSNNNEDLVHHTNNTSSGIIITDTNSSSSSSNCNNTIVNSSLLPLKHETTTTTDNLVDNNNHHHHHLIGDPFGLVGLCPPGPGSSGNHHHHHHQQQSSDNNSAQPLGSNVIKQQQQQSSSSSMEVQYMQQQSQIFVFSTVLANSGADEVLQGRYPSIIAYHCAQPGTKKYLEKNPLKITQFNRQPSWINNFPVIKSGVGGKNCTRSPSGGGGGGGGGGGLINKPSSVQTSSGLDNFLVGGGNGGNPDLDDMVSGLDGGGNDTTNWDQKSGHHQHHHHHHLGGLIDGGVTNNNTTNGLSDMDSTTTTCSPSTSTMLNIQPKLQGVQVPDENLTLQQRQHREERLASLRKIQQLFFPEGQQIQQSNNNDNNSSITTTTTTTTATTTTTESSSVLNHHHHHHHQIMGASSSQIEWSKCYDNKIKHQTMNNNPNNTVVVGSSRNSAGPPLSTRLQQGPPPPYHQTQRSASVPIALQSPNPQSPNNPTSNLSLPSPRASSALNSPADSSQNNNNNNNNRPSSFGAGGLTRTMSNTGQSPTRSQDSPSQRLNNNNNNNNNNNTHSNPSTPLSSHLSPSVNNTTNNNNNTDSIPSSAAAISTHQSTVDGMFGRSLHSMGKQQQTNSASSSQNSNVLLGKEPNLMPVPSPQQIQYLNTFEGQELIIQKQPNTSLKEGNILSPPVLPSNLDNQFSGNTSDLPPQHTRGVSGPNTPNSMDSRYPPTPSGGGVGSDVCRFPISSPHTPTGGVPSSCSNDKSQQRIPGQTGTPGMSPTGPGPQSDPLKNDLFPTPSPHMMDMPRFSGPNTSPGSQNKMNSPFGGQINVSPQQQQQQQQQGVVGGKPSNQLDLPSGYCGGRNDNIPLNPMVGGLNSKQSHFDPISSLTQMNQQLTNSVVVPSSLNGQGPGGQGPPMMNFGSQSIHMMDMGQCHGGMNDMDPSGMMGMPPMHNFHTGSPMGHNMRSSHSPKLGGFPSGNHHMPPQQMQRMMGRPPPGGPNSPFNGANVQVKPNAPNTIQYLPAKGQGGGGQGGQGPPRGPPALDFLRLASPLSMMDASKMQQQQQQSQQQQQQQGGQYFQTCGSNHPMGGHPMGHHMDMGHPQDAMMGPGPMGVGGHHLGNGNGLNGPMMGGPGGMNMAMMRGVGGGGGVGGMRGPMLRVPQMGGFGGGGGGGGGGPPDGIFPGGNNGPGGPQMGGPGIGVGNPGQMFVAGPKGSPSLMGMAPDASQPLPPSMGQSGGFKGTSSFVGQMTSDPNYAQQYHNFQQQLYATNPRGGGQMGQGMGPGGPGPPPHMQH